MATNTSVMEYIAIGQIIDIPSSSNLSFLNLLKYWCIILSFSKLVIMFSENPGENRIFYFNYIF